MLQEIFNFFKENYWWIVPLFIALVQSILLLFFKKRPQIYDASYYRDLMLLIRKAEIKFGAGHGEDKMKYVLDQYISLKNLPNDSWNRNTIRHVVEIILSIPQKKGGN